MSDYKVAYTTILNIMPHNGADRLEIATVYGFQIIVQKNKYEIGNKIIYIPIDSLLPIEIEDVLFPKDSKIKLHNSRIKQIRIRGLASQGMIVDPKDLSFIVNFDKMELETDLQDILNITKYEPPIPGFSQTIGKDRQRTKRTDHPLFHKYNGLDSIKWFPDLFQEKEQVSIQSKLHGTNARASVLPFQANTLFKKVKKFFGLAPKHENCYGSNNVEISSTSGYKGFYGEDIYGITFSKIDIFNKLKLGETVYGEIIGPSIQKGYTYDLKELHFVVFDVKILQPDGKQKWLNPSEVEIFCKDRGFDMVPTLYSGPYNKELAYSLTKGDESFKLDSLQNLLTQKVREGIVIKSLNNYHVEGNKRALKWVSEDYLAGDNTDFH